MLKTILNYMCIVLIIIISSGCAQDINNLKEQSANQIFVDEELYTEVDEYNNKYIDIKYPIISGMKDEKTQQQINKELKAIAFAVLNDFTSLEGMDIRTSYSVTLSSSRILSIIYTASSAHTVQAYPLVRTHTANVDLETGKILSVDDILTIDDDFMTLFHEKFQNISEYDSSEDKDRVNQYVSEIVSYDMLTEGSEGSYPEVSYFLTQDSLVISIAVPYSLGSYVLYSVDYPDISEYLLIEY